MNSLVSYGEVVSFINASSFPVQEWWAALGGLTIELSVGGCDLTIPVSQLCQFSPRLQQWAFRILRIKNYFKISGSREFNREFNSKSKYTMCVYGNRESLQMRASILE